MTKVFNICRELYIKIGIDARGVAFDQHEYKIAKRNHIDMVEYIQHKAEYDDKQISPYEQWQQSYVKESRHTIALIKKLFSILQQKNKTLQHKTEHWLEESQWLKIADKYDYLQEHC